MKKNIIKILFIICIILFNISIVYATVDYKSIYEIGNGNKIVSLGSTIAGMVKYVALVVAIIVAMIQGIKLIISSPTGKAEVMKQFTPWLIGMIILFSASAIIEQIIDISQKNINPL